MKDKHNNYETLVFHVYGSQCLTKCPYVGNMSIGSDGCHRCSSYFGTDYYTDTNGRPVISVRCLFSFNQKKNNPRFN